ncbi:hypothetical protein BMETH_13131791469, partial [methanotrophic bacterial endosymbiont of Bathymodiolus sp.]
VNIISGRPFVLGAGDVRNGINPRQI